MVYVLHFCAPYKHARHYTGYCDDAGLERRLAQHRAGRGARLMAVITAAGIGFVVAEVFPGAGRTFERQLKCRGAARVCPVCGRQAHRSRYIGKLYF